MMKLLFPLPKLLFSLFLVFSMGYTGPSFAAMNNAEAVNMSGLQRMLSQRIAKAYLMLGAGINTKDAQEQLDKSIALFESNFLELSEYAPTDTIKNKLNVVEEAWSQYRMMAIQRPSKSDAPEMIEHALKVFNVSNDLVSEIELYSKTSKARLVNISGRQRALSQRIAMYYQALAWGVNSDYEQPFEETIHLFETSLEELSQSSKNTPEIQRLITKVKAQWSFSKSGFNQHKEGRFMPTAISVTTESILKKMQEITKKYELVMSA